MGGGPTESKPPRLWWPFSGYYGWVIASTGLVVSFASVPMYGPVLSVWVIPITEDTGWSRTEISTAFTIGSFAGSMLTAVVGRLMDRHGARVVTVVAGMIITGALLGLALMQAPWQMWLFYGAGRGFAIAGVQLGTTVAISNWFIQKRGKAISFPSFGLRFGQALVPLAAAPIIILLGWREAWAILAGAVLLLIVVPAFVFIRRRPEDYGLRPDGASSDAPPGEAAGRQARHQAAVEAEAWTLAEARKTAAFWLILVAVSMMFFAQTATNLHAAPHFQERGISFGGSAFIVFTFSITSALSTIAWGPVFDRLHVRWVLIMLAGTYMLSMAIILVAHSFAGAILFGLVFGFAQGGWTLCQRLMVPNYFGRQSVGAIRGFQGPIMAFINPIGPVFAGGVRDLAGNYDIAYLVFAATFAAVIVIMLFTKPPRHPRSQVGSQS